MLATVDFKELRDLGWRKKNGHEMTYPRRPKEFELSMRLKGRRIKEIHLLQPGDFGGERIFTPSRGFFRAAAKKRLSGSAYKEVLHALEHLHDRFAITL